jgi:CheY-like chemotaxis protein
MAPLPLVGNPHLYMSTKLVNEMLKQGSAGTRVSNRPSQIEQMEVTSAVLRNPNQAFGRGPVQRSGLQKSIKSKKSSRRLNQSVLIVDDVPDVTEMIGLFLKHAGYEVVTADSAPAALRLAHERAFDLIISDIGMPEMNGYELAESLRRRAEYQGVPIIAVTGYSEYDDRGRALQSGFNAHLTKPIDPAELLKLMNELLG